MTLRPYLLPLILALVLSLVGMTLSAMQADRWHAALSATLFTVTAIIAGFKVNAPLWNTNADAGARATTPAIAMMRTARITAMVYVWGGACMFAIFYLSGLHWRHSWQYGSAMTAVAIGHILYVRMLSKNLPCLATEGAIDNAARLAALHGVIAGAGLAYVIASGKLYTTHDDWAANVIFVAGCLMVICLSAFAVRSHRELSNRPA
jgi:hypothetical protein